MVILYVEARWWLDLAKKLETNSLSSRIAAPIVTAAVEVLCRRLYSISMDFYMLTGQARLKEDVQNSLTSTTKFLVLGDQKPETEATRCKVL